eukprot:TRINITY_DN1145_c0_g2_i1.p1 TRINITY_DN1145_c0_g2~~TRINITY_DN1145_c0_g2_i1.p1  ORF type:complete len:769 (+),score=356.46 TRINITY_DN1145_c0_g2_i1:84-2390(+)
MMLLSGGANARRPVAAAAARARRYNAGGVHPLVDRYNTQVRREVEMKKEVELDEKHNVTRLKVGDPFDPTLPRNPKGAKGTVLGQVVMDGKRAGRLPDEEYLELAREKHPAMPITPKPTGEWLLEGASANEVVQGSDIIGGGEKARLRTMTQAQNDARMAKRNVTAGRMEAMAIQNMKDSKAFDPTALDSSARSRVDEAAGSLTMKASKQDSGVHPALSVDDYRRKAQSITPMKAPFPVDSFPPLPDDVPPQRQMTSDEWGKLEKMEEERDRTTQRIYDEAFQKWKLQKKVESQRGRRAGESVLDDRGEDEAAAKKRRAAAEDLQAKEAAAPDPLEELEKEMFPERFEEATKENADFEAKKKEAQLNLKPLPNALTVEMQKNILAKGVMPLAEFMKEANLHPQYGYYVSKKKVFGRDGDFITSPEISSMFAECICAWALDTWDKLGKPEAFHLIELGGGKGTLLARLLKNAKESCPEFYAAAKVGMVEVSPTLVATQKETIEQECGADALNKIEWAEDFDALDLHDDKYPTISYCNELFDVFAISKFQYTERGWCEWMVEIDEDPGSPEHFKFVLSSAETGASVMFLPHDVRQEAREKRQLGRTIEMQMQGYVFLERLLTTMSKGGRKGSFLAFDYGHDAYVEDSLRGIRGHEFVHPLSNPGEVDLSAMVSFKMLAGAVKRNEQLAKKIHVTKPMNQGEFLRRTGIEARLAHHLTKVERGRDSAKLAREFTKLVDEEDSDGMGHRFKVMAFSTKGELVPPCPWLPSNA